MPYSKVSEAPANIRKLNGISLTTTQVNWIARVADGIPKGQVDNPWAVSIAQFKRAHKVEGDKWVSKSKKEEKELTHIIKALDLEGYFSITDEAVAIIEKNDEGTYNITTVSTAAVKDREGETFTVEAIDYDIAEAERTKDYPEYRVYHSKQLGIGKVHSMKRVGIFAVEEGVSYDDPFSLAVCEKMLANNDGRWRVSRGFRVYELGGACPECDKSLLISTKHMLAGYRCPSCETVHLRFKGVLNGIRFKKARTFDVTVTDVPAVPYTGAHAWKNEDFGGISMTKEELKQRLVDAGIPEDAVDTRLKDVTDKQLKEFDDIPEAELLKEFKKGTPEDDPDDSPVEVDFEDLTSAFKQVVRDEVEAALDGFQIDVDGFDFEMKEVPGIVELKEAVADLVEKMDALLEKDENRLKELLADTPRSGKLRIKRMKAKRGDEDEDEEDEDEEEDIDELAKQLGVTPDTLGWIQHIGSREKSSDGEIVDSTGKTYQSMTAMVHGNAE